MNPDLLSQDKKTIRGDDGRDYVVGSPEASQYLLESSKRFLDIPIEEAYKDFSAPAPDKEVAGAIDQGIDYYKGVATTPVDEDAIRRSTLAMFQKEIDAVNQVYAEKFREAKLQGQNRVGTGVAIGARSGTLGSDFGRAQADKIARENASIEGSVLAEQAAKIAEITGTARSLASAEISAKRKAQEEGLDSYLSFLGKKTERKSAGLKQIAAALLAQGIDPKEANPEELQKTADAYGVTLDELLASYATEKQAAEKQAIQDAKDRRIELGEGQAIYEAQPDGSYKFVAKNPKTTSPGSGAKLGLSSAKSLGLPITLSDQPREAVIASLQSPLAPVWFIQELARELGMDQSIALSILDPQSPIVKEKWEAKKESVQAKYEADDLAATINALAESLSGE